MMGTSKGADEPQDNAGEQRFFRKDKNIKIGLTDSLGVSFSIE